MEQDVRTNVRKIIRSGGGIVTGGALGVDYIATDEALKSDPTAKSLRVILPTSLSDYANHYFKRAGEGVITQKQAQDLVEQLNSIKNANRAALTEMGYSLCNEESYYARNGKVIEAADRLLAFQVNGSAGTQDAIDKALSRGIPVDHKKYKI